MTDEPDARPIGFRDVLAGVNLRDFFDMVKGETSLVFTAARNAVHVHPLLMPFALVLVAFRMLLLFGVIVVFGGGILLIVTARTVGRLTGRGEDDSTQHESEDDT